MGLHNHEKRENKCVAKRRKSFTSGVCDKNAIDWASNDLDTTMVEGCRDYPGKNDSFTKQHTWVGMATII
jgi:hypothetical protein